MYLTKYYLTHKLPSGRNILINTLTGSVDFVSEKVIRQLEDSKCKPPELEASDEVRLRMKKYIYDSEEEEKKLVDKMYLKEKLKLRQKPYVFVFCLTYACNLRCFYCFEDNYHQTASVMRKKDVDAAVRFMEQTLIGEKNQTFRVVLEGGEPFLDGQWEILCYFFEQMKLLSEKYDGFKGVSVFTNGENTLSYLDLLRQNRPVIERVLITLAGSEKIHDSYRLTLSGASNYQNVMHTTSVLLEKGFPVLTVLNLDKNNIRSLPEISEELKDRKWNGYKNYLGCYVSSIKYFDPNTLDNALSEYDIWNTMLDYSRRKQISESLFNLGDLKVLKNIDRLIRCGDTNFFHCAANNGRQYLFGPEGLLYNCTKVTAQKDYSIGCYHEMPAVCEEKARWWTSAAVSYNSYCNDCRYAFICGGKCRYAEDRLGIRRQVCTRDTGNLLRLYLDNMETGEYFVQKDVIYDN